jgi:uncharacterized membrane protein YdfJ with MMPL/SSD domain
MAAAPPDPPSGSPPHPLAGTPLLSHLARFALRHARALLLATLAVAAALASLLVFPQPYFFSMGLAVVLGLSTDYGVFLLDRIRELHKQGLPNQQAVALGLQRTGRIITSAALLLCVAIGSIATSELVEVKEVAVGIAAAILIDATIVRSLLVPALMRLLGEWNWWRPRLAQR